MAEPHAPLNDALLFAVAEAVGAASVALSQVVAAVRTASDTPGLFAAKLAVVEKLADDVAAMRQTLEQACLTAAPAKGRA